MNSNKKEGIEMLHEKIETKKAPPPGNYSQARAIDLGNCKVVYTAGQTGNIPETDEVIEGGIGPQTRQALENIKGIIEDAGGALEDIVKVTVFMKDMKNDKAGFEEVYKSFFKKPYPARSLIEVSEIPLVSEPTIVEIEAVAYIKK